MERLTGRELSLQSLYRYLYYYKRKGWVAQDSPLWSLTELGEKRRKEGLQIRKNSRPPSFNSIIRDNQFCKKSEGLSRVEDPRNLVENLRNQVEETLQRGKLCSTREKYSRIANELGEDEKEVLKYLVEHRCKWGSNYRYFDELLRVLRRLQSKKLVYLYEDKRKHAVRVGLGKTLRE